MVGFGAAQHLLVLSTLALILAGCSGPTPGGEIEPTATSTADGPANNSPSPISGINSSDPEEIGFSFHEYGAYALEFIRPEGSTVDYEMEAVCRVGDSRTVILRTIEVNGTLTGDMTGLYSSASFSQSTGPHRISAGNGGAEGWVRANLLGDDTTWAGLRVKSVEGAYADHRKVRWIFCDEMLEVSVDGTGTGGVEVRLLPIRMKALEAMEADFHHRTHDAGTYSRNSSWSTQTTGGNLYVQYLARSPEDPIPGAGLQGPVLFQAGVDGGSEHTFSTGTSGRGFHYAPLDPGQFDVRVPQVDCLSCDFGLWTTIFLDGHAI